MVNGQYSKSLGKIIGKFEAGLDLGHWAKTPDDENQYGVTAMIFAEFRVRSMKGRPQEVCAEASSLKMPLHA